MEVDVIVELVLQDDFSYEMKIYSPRNIDTHYGSSLYLSVSVIDIFVWYFDINCIHKFWST